MRKEKVSDMREILYRDKQKSNNLPACSFVNCIYNKDYNCTKLNEYERCSRGNIFTLTEKVYEKYPDDKDIWMLLQEVTRIGQKINKVVDELGL